MYNMESIKIKKKGDTQSHLTFFYTDWNIWWKIACGCKQVIDAISTNNFHTKGVAYHDGDG